MMALKEFLIIGHLFVLAIIIYKITSKFTLNWLQILAFVALFNLSAFVSIYLLVNAEKEERDGDGS